MDYPLNKLLEWTRRASGDRARNVRDTFVTTGESAFVLTNDGGITLMSSTADGEAVDINTLTLDGNTVTFATAPADGSDLAIAYAVTKYTDAELLDFLADAAVALASDSAADLLTYPLEVTLFCTDDGQRKDLADDILEGLKAVPLLDMADTPFLTDTGDANLDFNCNRQRLGFANVFNRLSRLLHPRVGGLDKERYRALVTANIKNVS